MSAPNWWGDWRPTLTPHTGDLQPTDLLECTMIVGGLPVNTVITGQQIIDGAGGGGAVGYYAQYQDNITQPLGAVNVGQPAKFRTMDFSNGVTVVSDTQITIANTGIYNLQFSFQFQNIDSQEHDVTIWLRKNGADVAGSAGFVAVVSSHGGTPGHCIPSWNYLLDAVGGDYYELYWSATSTQVTMEYYPAGSPPPATASAIFTVTQQAGIIAGTGMTALNGLSADVQTISTGTTGTDFNVVSSGSNHAFNLPTASATNRGALSSANWSTFNAKQDALVSGTNIKTVNGNSLLGSGNLTITGGSGLQGYHNVMGFFPSGFGTSAHITANTPTNLTTSTNLIYLNPLIIQNSITYTSIRFNVITAVAGSNARIVVYSNSSALPNAKIYESADVSCATTGLKTITATGTFTVGTIYWIGIHLSGAPTLGAITVQACLPIAVSTINAAPITGWTYSYTFGSAPATLNQAFRTAYANVLPIIQFIQ